MSDPVSQFTLTYPDGHKVTIDPSQFWATLASCPEIDEMTVSVKESRQHAKYIGGDRFLSANVNFRSLWKMVGMVQNPAERFVARQYARQVMQKEIMETEDHLFFLVGGMLAKSGLDPFWRNPDNPFVRAGWDVEKGILMDAQNRGAR